MKSMILNYYIAFLSIPVAKQIREIYVILKIWQFHVVNCFTVSSTKLSLQIYFVCWYQYPWLTVILLLSVTCRILIDLSGESHQSGNHSSGRPCVQGLLSAVSSTLLAKCSHRSFIQFWHFWALLTFLHQMGLRMGFWFQCDSKHQPWTECTISNVILHTVCLLWVIL